MYDRDFGVFSHLRSDRLRHMWLGLVLLLAAAVVLAGCTHFTTLEAEEQSTMLKVSDCNMQITLKDGSWIASRARHYLEVTTPSSFMYVSGTFRFSSGGETVFSGRIDPAAAETVLDGSRQKYRFLLGGGSTVTCWPEDCIFVDSAGGPGLWLVGTLHQGSSSAEFRGKVEEGNVASIEFQQANTAGTTILVLGGAVLLVGAISIIVFMNDFSMSWGHYR